MKNLDKKALKKFSEVMGEDFQVILALAGEDLERKLVEFIDWLILEIESTRRRELTKEPKEQKEWRKNKWGEEELKFEDSHVPYWKDHISTAVPSKYTR